jgi:cysteinyl-tRNA synthetase
LCRRLFLGGLVVLGLTGCAPVAAPAPVISFAVPRDVPRRRREIDVTGRFLSFHGRADQLGDLSEIASIFRVIAIDADPADGKFSRADIAALRAGGRNIVLGNLDVGFCDRSAAHWSVAPDGLLPCVANLAAQIGERSGRPQEVWMDLEDEEYQRLIGEYEAPQIERAAVDGFLLEGLDLLDHGPDDDEAPCDEECVGGGLALLAALRDEFPQMSLVIQGGLSPGIRKAHAKRSDGEHVQEIRVSSLIDGVVGEEVYTPRYNPGKEAALLAWQKMGARAAEHPLAIFTQDYVRSCRDVDWARVVYRASASHGFSPGIGPPPVSRGPACRFGDL